MLKKSNTKSEEDYLKNIFLLSRKEKIVALNDLTKQLKLKSSSITSMLKKLEEKKLIKYEPYKGVRLLEKGKRLAIELLRKHRLWECFLYEKLKFNWSEVHAIAEQLEHVDSEKLTEKLEEFLDFPKFDPHGDPIPSKNEKIETIDEHERENINLTHLKKGETGVLVRVITDNEELLHYLNTLKIALGSKIKITSRMDFDNSLEIIINNKKNSFISNKTAKALIIKKI